MSTTTDLMVRDFAVELAIRLEEARANSKHGDDFEFGRMVGLRRALNMLMEQTTAFGITPEYLGIDRIKL
jgi:hypothetical protein